MKKLFSYILIFALGMATAAGAIFSPRAFAYAADGETAAQATTEIFLPTTYLQYYKNLTQSAAKKSTEKNLSRFRTKAR